MRILDALNAEKLYRRSTKRSFKMFVEACKIMPGGQSHNARFFAPYPFYASKASGKHVWDVDGNRYTDYWMGHTALIFGHSPPFVVRALKDQSSKGLLYGAPNMYAYELARLVNQIVPSAESIRFCSTGAEATMYAVRLARGFTKKKIVVKMAGGWHGYNSALTVGVSNPYEVPESNGLDSEEELHVKLGRFNNIEETKKILEENAEDIACVIIEPVMGSGGVLPVSESYLRFLRDECSRMGALLIFDEIITGFRLALGGAQERYKIKPDISTLGKILGGGLPVSAVVGRSDILDLVDTNKHREKTERVWIGGGTFSENALCMCAGIATLSHLIEQKKTIYPRLERLGTKLRKSTDKVLAENGYKTKTTGAGSLFATHFLSKEQTGIDTPEEVNASDRMTEKRYYFSLIAEHGIYFLPGHIGAISSAHTNHDVDEFIEATASFGKKQIVNPAVSL
ncbi:MAG: aspartate aminotransferase family protein [Nitrososphaerota archaeon]|nr:aspartate aminotransferase family protein [Nitrososphaerota archaeon]MDG6922580.1 aspartate aminotransferase family protein [Nitrososphaerota archaeon]